MSYTIIQDSREQHPLNISFFTSSCLIERKLDTGDYTIEGLEDKLFIDRKATTAELAMNIGSDWVRFKAELERTRSFKYKYILCEFPEEYLSEFPKYSTIPKYKWKYLRVKSGFLKKQINYIADEYEILFVFCQNVNDAAKQLIYIMDNVYAEIRSK